MPTREPLPPQAQVPDTAETRMRPRAAATIAVGVAAMQAVAWSALWTAFGVLGIGYHFFDLSDIGNPYYPYAVNLAKGMAAYRDFFVEYPPLFVPVLFAGGATGSVDAYALRFAVVMMAFMALTGVVTAFAAAEGAGAGRPLLVGALFAMFTLVLGPISANRYDAVVALAIAVALLLMMRRRWEFAALAVGVGFALKITPALLLPILLVLAPKGRRWRSLWAFALAALLPFAWVASLGGKAPGAILTMLGYHLSRPLEVESVLALPLWIAHLGGMPLTVTDAAGSQVLTTSAANALASFSAVALAGALGATLYLIWRRRQSIRLQPRLIALATLATVLASLVGSKVLSPQYFVWLVPALALVAPDRKVLAVGVGGAMLLTQVLFPALYMPFVLNDLPAAVAIVVARNVLVVASFVLAAWYLWSLPEEPGAPAES